MVVVVGGLFCFPYTISGPDTMTLAGFHPRKIPSQPRSSHSTPSVQHILPPPKHKKVSRNFSDSFYNFYLTVPFHALSAQCMDPSKQINFNII